MIKFNLEKNNLTVCIHNEGKQSWALTLSIASGSGAGTTLEEKKRLLMVYGEIGTETMHEESLVQIFASRLTQPIQLCTVNLLQYSPFITLWNRFCFIYPFFFFFDLVLAFNYNHPGSHQNMTAFVTLYKVMCSTAMWPIKGTSQQLIKTKIQSY